MKSRFFSPLIFLPFFSLCSFGADAALLDAIIGEFEGAYAASLDEGFHKEAIEETRIIISKDDDDLEITLFLHGEREWYITLPLAEIQSYFSLANKGILWQGVAFKFNLEGDAVVQPFDHHLEKNWSALQFKFMDKKLVAFRLQEQSSDGFCNCTEITNMAKVGVLKTDWDF